MAESIVSDIIARLLEYLGQSVAEEVASYFGGRANLKELKMTMKMIQARLLDAERRGESKDGVLIKEWLKGLKQLLYRLEDLFQEVSMADKEREQITGGKLTKSLNVLLSRLSPLRINKKVAREAKAVMEGLKAITSDMLSLNLRENFVEEPPRGVNLINMRETHSFVVMKTVIGRDDDKRAITEMILRSDLGDGVAVLPIIGIGGLGKTSLAQLVFNDKQVEQHFELKCWACISDVSSLEEAARKILKSITRDDCSPLSMEQLQSLLRSVFNDKKYLLVLDDIWDDNRERWLGLRDLLCGGKQGSTIIVTTRSRVVAENMGTLVPYELGGLSEDQSWELFRNLAFKDRQEEETNQDVVRIGKDIVKKCANVPLAIRTVAALLHSKDTVEEWEYLKDSELRDGIMSSLKLSYDHLPSHLKKCFAYCSLFPKTGELYKQQLTYLWMAQGLLHGHGHGQCPEDVGHVYFMELLRRSFFQEVLRDEHGDIIGCRMHDLMHDLAQMVAGDECLIVYGSTTHNTSDCYTRHVRFIAGSSWRPPLWLLTANQMRSLHLQTIGLTSSKILNIDEIFSSLRCLRALDLEFVDSPTTSPQIIHKTLPNSIAKLKQLRYVRLVVSSESLPECISELNNLQTLDLRGCYNLRELPRGFSKLTTLRHLSLSTPLKLIDMPRRFSQLTSLQALDVFIVGENNGLDTLSSLDNLAGKLEIHFVKLRGEVLSRSGTVEILNKMKLTHLVLRWFCSSWHQGEEDDDLVVKCMQPPPSLKRMEVFYWNGLRFPSWRMDLLPNLVSLQISDCKQCRHLPPLGQLPQLRFLKLFSLHSLEYIEISAQPFFLCLSELDIRRCLKLISMPQALRLESLILHESNGKLPEHLGCLTMLQELVMYKLSNLEAPLKWIGHLTQLRRLAIEDCPKLTEVAVFPCSLQQLDIRECGSLKGISFSLQCLSLLEELEIECCEELDLWDIIDHVDVDDDDDDVMSISSRNSKISYSSKSSSSYSSISPLMSGCVAWQGLKSLHSLKLVKIKKLGYLPRGLACLTTLEKLCIRLPNLRALPEWIVQLTHLRELFVGPELMTLPQSLRNFTSLQRLTIWNCSELQRRYRCPDDEYWSLVQHIPHFEIC